MADSNLEAPLDLANSDEEQTSRPRALRLGNAPLFPGKDFVERDHIRVLQISSAPLQAAEFISHCSTPVTGRMIEAADHGIRSQLQHKPPEDCSSPWSNNRCK